MMLNFTYTKTKLHNSNISIVPTTLKHIFFNICYFVMFILKMKMT